MDYSDFTLPSAESELGLTSRVEDLFPNLIPIEPPEWVTTLLTKSMKMPLSSEKSRSEFIIAPILLAVREISEDQVTVHSGERLDVDSSRKLVGECDFILSKSQSLPGIRAPLLTIIEAKRGEIESALGQCVAQRLGASLFNQQHDHPMPFIWGCVTTGELWQFLRLEGATVTVHQSRFYIHQLGEILSAFQNALTI